MSHPKTWLLLALLLALPATGSAQQVRRGTARPAPAGAKPLKAALAPADYRSQHFLVHTDLPSSDAHQLLKRLETMLELISKYWGQPLRGTIECYVVQDLANWPPDSLEADGRNKIRQRAGVTLTETQYIPVPGGRPLMLSKSTVYATADHGTPQHESVHAYCGQTFGTCGPLWYSEGMAEMGQYWDKEDPSVHIHPGVLRYLHTSEPQSLFDIVRTNSAGSVSGDSWQNYAWRWALCHLLANNVNYRERFRPLGLGFLTGQRVSFEEVYGPVAKEIAFEYLFFVQHIEQGYRVDLCSWDWKKKFKPLSGSTAVPVRVAADHGWQPSGIRCVAGEKYDYSAAGTWQLDRNARAVTADGSPGGAGRLVGVIFNDYHLGKSFELGSYGTFTAPEDGDLYLRCGDGWGQLADNKGALSIKFKPTGKGPALARPKDTPGDSIEQPPAAVTAASSPRSSVRGHSVARPATAPPATAPPAPSAAARPQIPVELPRPAN